VDSFFRREGLHDPKLAGYAMDLQAGAHVLDENMFQKASLVDLQFHFTDFREDYDGAFSKKYGKEDMLSVPVPALIEYGCADADVTKRASDGLRERLLQKNHERLAKYMAKFVMPTLQKALYTIERNGAWIDMDELPNTTLRVEQEMAAHQSEAMKVVPGEIKDAHKGKLQLTRDKLVGDVLFTDAGFGLQPLKKTKGGNGFSVDKEVRKRLMEQPSLPKRALKFLSEFNEWQELHTLWSRYLRGFEQHVRSDGYIHSSMSLATAVTGRVASSRPNMQNNPKRSKSAHLIRRLIAAPDGWLLMCADQGQSELRWCAEVAKEQVMRRIFREGLDIHVETAKRLVQKPWEQLTAAEKKKARQDAKPVNFGLLYLMTATGFVRYCFMEYGLVINEKQAQVYIETYFATYPGLRTYHKTTIEFARTHGYVEHVFGRRRRLPEINSRNDRDRFEAERQAVNHPIQGPSSDVVLMSGNEIVDMDLNPEEFRMSLFVHDELIFMVKETADVVKYGKLVKQAMENPPMYRDFGYKMSVPLISDVKVGKNLAETQPLEF
jgi:DNA polymerase I